jgi:hypothetical protein
MPDDSVVIPPEGRAAPRCWWSGDHEVVEIQPGWFEVRQDGRAVRQDGRAVRQDGRAVREGSEVGVKDWLAWLYERPYEEIPYRDFT